MGVKVIVELTIQPGRRGEFVSQYESLAEQHESSMRAAGWLGGTMHAVVDDPDKVVEIANWESVQAREAAMEGMMGSFGPLFEMLSGPFKATVIEPL